MVNFCGMNQCSNRGDRDNKSFYRLPALITREGEKTRDLSQKRREKWLSRISRRIKTSNLPYVRVCSDHFISGKPSTLYDFTNPDWAPTVKLGHDKIQDSAIIHDTERFNQSVLGSEKKKQVEAAEALINLQESTHVNGMGDKLPIPDLDKCSQTTLQAEMITNTEKEIQQRLSENNSLKEKLSAAENKLDRLFS